MINCTYCNNFELCGLKQADSSGDYYKIYCDHFRSIKDAPNFSSSYNDKKSLYCDTDEQFVREMMSSFMFYI